MKDFPLDNESQTSQSSKNNSSSAENTDSEWEFPNEIDVMEDEKVHRKWKEAQPKEKGWLPWLFGG